MGPDALFCFFRNLSLTPFTTSAGRPTWKIGTLVMGTVPELRIGKIGTLPERSVPGFSLRDCPTLDVSQIFQSGLRARRKVDGIRGRAPRKTIQHYFRGLEKT
jgi:hypothetical protein